MKNFTLGLIKVIGTIFAIVSVILIFTSAVWALNANTPELLMDAYKLAGFTIMLIIVGNLVLVPLKRKLEK